MLNTAPNELEAVPLHAEFASSIDLPLPMLARKMIAETSEHNIYAGAGLSSPFRLSSVMILSFQFLLPLYDCTISTTLLVHLCIASYQDKPAPHMNSAAWFSLSHTHTRGEKHYTACLHTWMCGSEFWNELVSHCTVWYDLIRFSKDRENVCALH